MSAAGRSRRGRTAIALALMAGATSSMAARGWSDHLETRTSTELGEPFLPEFVDASMRMRKIVLTTPDDTLVIEGRPGQHFALVSRGDFPIRDGMMEDLAQALSGAEIVRAMTADAAMHSRLQVVDPSEAAVFGAREGYGAKLTMLDAADQKIASFIIGSNVGKQLYYVRREGDDQTYQIRTKLPDLHAVRHWADLNFTKISQDQVRSVSVKPAEGAGFVLTRAASDRGFDLATQDNEPAYADQLAAEAAAFALAQVEPVDVRREKDLFARVVGEHQTETFDGLRVTVRTLEDEQRARWLVVEAWSLTPQMEEAAAKLRASTEGWAFKIEESEAKNFTAQLGDVVAGGGRSA